MYIYYDTTICTKGCVKYIFVHTSPLSGKQKKMCLVKHILFIPHTHCKVIVFCSPFFFFFANNLLQKETIFLICMICSPHLLMLMRKTGGKQLTAIYFVRFHRPITQNNQINRTALQITCHLHARLCTKEKINNP